MPSTPLCHRPSRLRRAGVLAAAAVAAVAAHAGIRSERLLAAIMRHTPAAAVVSAGQQIRAAEARAATIPGAEAMWGVGRSMEPLYASHTALVVAPISYGDLRKGMTVVYRGSNGSMIAHSLTGDVPDGWIAQGVGNNREDNDLVTPDNLIGVIVAAYSEIHSPDRVMLARQLIAHGRLPAGQS